MPCPFVLKMSRPRVLARGAIGEGRYSPGCVPRSGKTGWWPFDSSDEVPAREHGRWLLVLLDPATYRVVAAAAIDDPEPAVTIDAQTRVWVATKKDVLLLDPAGTLVELDVAARLRTE